MTRSDTPNLASLQTLVRQVLDFPRRGIRFYDITPLLRDKHGFAALIDALVQPYLAERIDLVLGIEARGFIFGPAMAYRLNAGFVPVRKPGKLPAETLGVTYALEYGHDRLEIHRDAIAPGQRVIVVDDLLATGGTAVACVELARTLGADLVGAAFAVELTWLKGRARLDPLKVESLLQYDR